MFGTSCLWTNSKGSHWAHLRLEGQIHQLHSMPSIFLLFLCFFYYLLLLFFVFLFSYTRCEGMLRRKTQVILILKTLWGKPYCTPDWPFQDRTAEWLSGSGSIALELLTPECILLGRKVGKGHWAFVGQKVFSKPRYHFLPWLYLGKITLVDAIKHHWNTREPLSL